MPGESAWPDWTNGESTANLSNGPTAPLEPDGLATFFHSRAASEIRVAHAQACPVQVDPIAQMRPVADQRLVGQLHKGIRVSKVAFGGEQRLVSELLDDCFRRRLPDKDSNSRIGALRLVSSAPSPS
jgi:hypothetical protein